MDATQTPSRATTSAQRGASTHVAIPSTGGLPPDPSPDQRTAAALTVELVPVAHLLPDPANPRRIDPAEHDALDRSLRQFGFVQPVLARRTGRVALAHELDPVYVDVALARWEAFSGQNAVRSDG
jgi:hypothetical protein